MSDSQISHEEIVVLQLKDMFRRTGILHDRQVLNLQTWPLLLFPQAKKAEIQLAYELRTVAFLLHVPPSKSMPRNTAERGARLTSSVQFLLGDDFEVEVKRNGKTIFRGPRVKALDVKDYSGVDFAAGKIVPKTPWKFKKSEPPPKKG